MKQIYYSLLFISLFAGLPGLSLAQPKPVHIENITADSYFKTFLKGIPYHLDDGDYETNVIIYDERFLRFYGQAVDDLTIDINEKNRINRLEITLINAKKDTSLFIKSLDKRYGPPSVEKYDKSTEYSWKPEKKHEINLLINKEDENNMTARLIIYLINPNPYQR